MFEFNNELVVKALFAKAPFLKQEKIEFFLKLVGVNPVDYNTKKEMYELELRINGKEFRKANCATTDYCFANDALNLLVGIERSQITVEQEERHYQRRLEENLIEYINQLSGTQLYKKFEKYWITETTVFTSLAYKLDDLYRRGFKVKSILNGDSGSVVIVAHIRDCDC